MGSKKDYIWVDHSRICDSSIVPAFRFVSTRPLEHPNSLPADWVTSSVEAMTVSTFKYHSMIATCSF